MGTIDSVTVILTCSSCGVTESSRALDEGSGWKGSSWQRPSFAQFEVSVTGLDRAHFDIEATCPRCDLPAAVDEQFAT